VLVHNVASSKRLPTVDAATPFGDALATKLA
jgi:hypothetical protein